MSDLNILANLLRPAAAPMRENMLTRLLLDAPTPGADMPPTPGYTEARNPQPTRPGWREIVADTLDPNSRGNRIVMGFAANPATFRTTGALDLYHGTRATGIGELRPSERGPFGPAVYMSPARNVAQQYAGESGQMYSAQVPPDAFYGLGRSWISNGSQVNPYQVWRDQVARLVDAAPANLREQIAELGGRMDPSDGYPFFRRLSGMMGGDEAAQALFRRAGFTGVSGIVDGPEVAIFDSVPVRPAP
jgi:hypothetical protein